MVKYLKTFCLIFIISNSLICDPYEQLDIDFLKTSNKKTNDIKLIKTSKINGLITKVAGKIQIRNN